MTTRDRFVCKAIPAPVKGQSQYVRALERARRELVELGQGPLSQILKTQIQKMNPYHDARGRFASRASAFSVSVGPAFEKQLAKLRANEALAQNETFLGGTEKIEDGEVADQLAVATEDQWQSFTKEERKAAYQYTGDRYMEINKAETTEHKKMSDNLQSALMTKTSIPENVITYRMLNVGRKAGIEATMFSDEAQMRSFIGREFKDPDFGSTSTRMSTAMSFRGKKNRVGMVIRVRKGARGLSVADPSRSPNSNEHEILLPRGATYRITGIKKTQMLYSQDMMWIFEVDHLGP